jgi:hypothetical protein
MEKAQAMKLPIARAADLIEQAADKELLIYDLLINKAYSLNETSKNVFQSCNGKTSFDELKQQYGYTDDLIHLTLGELKKINFIEAEYVSPFAGMSRREVIRKVGLASMIVLPVISTLVAPTAIDAASTCTADNPAGPQEGSGGTCYCFRSSTNNGGTCGTGIPIGSTPRVTTNCKAGCTCRRTQPTSSMNQPCSIPASTNPDTQSCLGVCQ